MRFELAGLFDRLFMCRFTTGLRLHKTVYLRRFVRTWGWSRVFDGRTQHHGFFEIGRTGLGDLVVDVFQLVFADFDYIIVLQEVLFSRFPIHFQPVGAIQVLEEGIVQDGNDRSMLTAHRQVVDGDVVV